MAKRGEILVAIRRLGFAARGQREHFVVLQSDFLAGIDTVIAAPLDADAPMYATDPLVVHVSAGEAGTDKPQVVLVHLLAAVRLDRFEVMTLGKLSPRSMGLVDRALRTSLHL